MLPDELRKPGGPIGSWSLGRPAERSRHPSPQWRPFLKQEAQARRPSVNESHVEFSRQHLIPASILKDVDQKALEQLGIKTFCAPSHVRCPRVTHATLKKKSRSLPQWIGD